MKIRLLEAMKEAADEEKQHAIETQDYHDGVPAITVVADAGWSKRTHKHSYNAKSGVAVIFGAHTKKLVFLSVRNKYCCICAIAEHKKEDPPRHRCYRNWDGSSAAMESDIISEGFDCLKLCMGCDTCVLLETVTVLSCQQLSRQYHNMFVNKVECANHACKSYRSWLEELIKNHPEYSGRGGLTKRAIQRVTVGARIAIQMHSSTGNVQQLRHDLRNGPSHVFGDHRKCNPQFCRHTETGSSTGYDCTGH